jgi:hypothetical protein
VAGLATLTAIFNTVENWRGQRAWENRRRELEAKGEVFDWAAYVPPPVPDDQNFYKAPKMREWFVREHFDIPGRDPTNVPNPFAVGPRKDTNLVVAEMTVVAPEAPLDSRTVDAVLRFDEPSARAQAEKFIRDAIGPCVLGARGGVLVAASPDQFKPAQLALKTAAVPTLKELTDFFPCNPLPNSDSGRADVHYLGVASAGSNAFRVYLKEPICGAADYLARTEPLTANFDLVRKALERPYARIDCDYQQPFAIAIPNFVRMRTAVQTLSERAQCNLLLNRPEGAWHELSLVHDLCEILKAKPSGKPITLVGAMINVAIADLYANIVKDGLRLHSWREPELLAIEKQLQATDLLAPLAEAFREERAATLRTFETTRRSELVKLFNFDSSLSKLALRCIPRGWFYQNMAVGAEVEQGLLATFDLTNQLVQPQQTDNYCRDLLARLQRRSPYTFLIAIATPNFMRAIQTTAHNQTQVNQARVACVLERYRLAQGQYPQTLEALTPHFTEKLPHDLVGGQPLKYRRNEGAGYVLYSIGWNQKDDNGLAGKSREEGDWVWEIH